MAKDERPISAAEQNWVDSVYTSLTPDQRLGQLFMVAAYSNKDRKHVLYHHCLLRNTKVGLIPLVFNVTTTPQEPVDVSNPARP